MIRRASPTAVLDGLMAYIDQQNRLERRMDDVEETVRKLAAA